MSAPRTAQSATPTPGPSVITGFDATNLAGAVEQLAAAQCSLDAIRLRDPRLAKRLDRLRGRLADLTSELRQLRGTR